MFFLCSRKAVYVKMVSEAVSKGRFTHLCKIFPCWYYCIQINSTHSAHLIALTSLLVPVFCFKAAFKWYKYKDLELHLVSFVRGCWRICPCATRANIQWEVIFYLFFVWKLQPWSPQVPHFSHFVRYQTDDWWCRKGVRRHSFLCFCFHRDFSNGQHPANLNRQ